MIAPEDHVAIGVGQLRPCYRHPSIIEMLSILLEPFNDLELAFRQLVDAREQGLRGEGYALDLAGQVVSLPRDGRDHARYLAALSARIAELNSSGTVEDLVAVLRALIPQDPARPSTIRTRRGRGIVDAQVIPDLGVDWVESPAGSGLIPELVDGAYTAGDTVINVQLGAWPEVGWFRIVGGAYSGQVFRYVADASRTTLAIAPALPIALSGSESLEGPLGMSRPALEYLRSALEPAVPADGGLNVSGGTVGVDEAFALASAVELAAPAAIGARELTTYPNSTRAILRPGWCHPAGSPVIGYRVTSPGVLSLDAPIVAAVSVGSLLPLVRPDGSDAYPGAGLGVGALWGVAGPRD